MVLPRLPRREKRNVKGGITNADLNVTSAIPTVAKSVASLILYNPECKDTAPSARRKTTKRSRTSKRRNDITSNVIRKNETSGGASGTLKLRIR